MSLEGFLWPLAALTGGTRPTISDGFKATAVPSVHRQHLGVDVMYRRPADGLAAPPAFTKHFMCPSGSSPVIAAGPGRVSLVDTGDKHGIVVELDHGQMAGFGPCMTVYRHLATIAVAQGQTIGAGTFLGFAGHDLAAGHSSPNHLHFEVWDTSRPRPAGSTRRPAFSIDPAPFMTHWKVKTSSGFTAPDSSPAGAEDAGETDEPGDFTALLLTDLAVIPGGIV